MADWIEVFYDGQRRYSTLGHITPTAFEQRYDNLKALWPSRLGWRWRCG